MNLKTALKQVGSKIERINQVVLCFPLWVVVGVSGFRRGLESQSWREEEQDRRPEKMY